ncbi:PREDICTED: serine/arginine repetitive matrix protein 1-like [Nanorana parkeri]|uniref:serine/arginine repetitive matrix protein 1-like n=1 Tax=Nanorana parkeri TaxID=125878 RepID=UPI000854E9B7|nr:PREDICTED: serine/arginine repetitive matrix protein 1-like [Nanorana parkeri]
MMARSGIRSSALARAEVQLAGQRVPRKPKDSSDELQEYMRALSNKSSALKLSQPSIANLNDLSASEHESEKHKGTVSPWQSTGTQSRFLKKKSPASKDRQSNVKPASVVSKPQPVQSKMPTSAALKRLAEFEKRHRMRKLELDISENDSDLRTSEERPFSNRSSSEFSSRGNRFLKKKVNIKEPEPMEQIRGPSIRGSSAENKRRVAESDEELQLIGSSVEFSENDSWWKRPKPPRTPSSPSRLTPRRNIHRSSSALGFFSPRRPPSRFSSRTPSPPSHGTPRYPRRTHSLTRFGSRSPSPSVRSSMTSNTPRARLGRRSRTPLSQRSDFKSLDELFSKADDLSSASSNDFKLNIMSLDELAPAAGTDELEEKVK